MAIETPKKNDRIHDLYAITNTVNGKVYIGQSVATRKRWYAHKREAAKDNPVSLISRAIKKHGNNVFEFRVIATCKGWDNANDLETLLVRQYNSQTPNGYNVAPGGINAPKSEEWKAHMSAIKGGWIGKNHTEENKEKFRQYHLGSIHSEETKQKRSQTMLEKCAQGWMPKTIFQPGSEAARYWKGKTSPRKGAVLSEETRQKISEAGQGRDPWNKGQSGVYSKETLQLMSEIRKGKRVSIATEFKKGQPSPRKGKKGGIAWNKGLLKTLTDSQQQEIQELLLNGYSLRQISQLVGIDRHLIAREIKRNIG